MIKPAIRTTKNDLPKAGWHARIVIVLVFVSLLLVAGFYWLVPIEVFEQWAFDRAGQDAFGQFESVGRADFFVWFWRIVAPLGLVLAWRVWRNLSQNAEFLVNVGTGLAQLTQSASNRESSRSRSFVNRVRTIGCRIGIVAWFVLFLGHSIHGLQQRAHDWPYFRWNSGEVVLPNISESNRMVIRYLQASTPPSARILVASDQKLFFLSYYLRPRTLFHRMHPDSEHVIPLKDQERRLAAYRLDELTAEDLAQMPHQYTLEYFEHPDLVDQTQVLSDSAWIRFVRQHERNPSLIPSYLVRLRKVVE
jgi:hypothetical protein